VAFSIILRRPQSWDQCEFEQGKEWGFHIGNLNLVPKNGVFTIWFGTFKGAIAWWHLQLLPLGMPRRLHMGQHENDRDEGWATGMGWDWLQTLLQTLAALEMKLDGKVGVHFTLII
jgi:hypothetical protein